MWINIILCIECLREYLATHVNFYFNFSSLDHYLNLVELTLNVHKKMNKKLNVMNIKISFTAFMNG